MLTTARAIVNLHVPKNLREDQAGDLLPRFTVRRAIPGPWVGLLTAATAVVPGHGPLVDREFVQGQRGDIVDVAEQIRELAATGVPVDEALDRGRWPFPADVLRDAVSRGYAALTT